MTTRCYLPLLWLAILLGLASCSTRSPRKIVVAFYNCENFFDTIHNTAKQDEEFTPGGKYRYTQKIYEQKLHNIAAVIRSMDGEGPAIVGLAEVENSNVLDNLISQPELQRLQYRYEWFDGPDPRGINVAMLYDPGRFTIISAEPLHVDLTGTGGKELTRDILHVAGVLAGDTVQVFVNHWPSRAGEESTAPKRARAAAALRSAILAARKNAPECRIIILGDFNDNPTDSSITTVLGASGKPDSLTAGGLYDPCAEMYAGGGGTEVFRHNWNFFDQVIISPSLLHSPRDGWQFDKVAVFKPDFITDHYNGHEGEPHRSFAGTHWINGYSDHFPVLLYLKK